MNDVVWKWIEGYEGLYQISSLGEVKSFKKVNLNGGLLKPRVSGRGYLQVVLYKDKKKSDKLIHRLVAEAFLQDWDNSKDVDHINIDRLNNHVDNLRMASDSQNQRNRVSLKGSSSKYKNVYWDRRSGKWRVTIRVNGKKKHIGLFTNEEEAGRAADEAARDFLSEEDLKYYRFNIFSE